MSNRYTIDAHGYIVLKDDDNTKFAGFEIPENVIIHTFIQFGGLLLCTPSIKKVNCKPDSYNLSLDNKYDFTKLPKYTFQYPNIFPNLLLIPDDTERNKTFYSGVYSCSGDKIIHNMDVIPEEDKCNIENMALKDVNFKNNKKYKYTENHIENFSCGAIFLKDAIEKIKAYDKSNGEINIHILCCLEEKKITYIRDFLNNMELDNSGNRINKRLSIRKTIELIDKYEIPEKNYYDVSNYPISTVDNSYRIKFNDIIFTLKFNKEIKQEEIIYRNYVSPEIKTIVKTKLKQLKEEGIDKLNSIKKYIDLTEYEDYNSLVDALDHNFDRLFLEEKPKPGHVAKLKLKFENMNTGGKKRKSVKKRKTKIKTKRKTKRKTKIKTKRKTKRKTKIKTKIKTKRTR